MGSKNRDSDSFLALTSEVIKSLTISEKHDHVLRDFDCWFEKMLSYNLLGGKLNRGTMVANSFSVLAEKKHVTEENIKLAHVLGWCIELLQAAFLVADDIMDNSKTRRGQPCWYLTNGLGPKAFNDALLMERAAFHILWKYHRDQTYYTKCVDLLNEIIFKTEKGQCLDLLTSSGSKPQLDLFTEERYATIVKYKTSYYSFYLPVGLAMIMAGMFDERSHSEVEAVLLKVGHLFQVQDDYLDCFGDPEVMGKVGTDIEEGKCSWLVVTILKHVDHHQRMVLEKNYGSEDPKHVSRVKNLYRDLSLPEMYRKFEDNSKNSILQDISNMENPNMRGLCTAFLNKILDRKR